MTEAWTYDALGNILTDATSTGGVTATTTYTYAGNTGSNYADPDATTQIGNDALTYDNNGNTLTGFGLTNAYDWRNRLATTTGPATIIYSYDENDQRMRENVGANTTQFPNAYFTKVFPSASSTAHVLLNGRTIADAAGATTSAVLTYVYGDNLGSAEVTADANNRVQEVTDFAPFGAIQNHDQLAGYSEERKYAGQEYDGTLLHGSAAVAGQSSIGAGWNP